MSQEAREFFQNFPKDMERVKQAMPDAVKGFGAMFQNIMKDGALTTKQKELIALGIAMAQRCNPCIQLHVQKCVASGNTPAEVMEAASVAVVMQGGPAYTHLPLVLDALEVIGKS